MAGGGIDGRDHLAPAQEREGTMTASDVPSQLCRYCRETVRPDAKKCPHCHQWLRPGVRRLYLVVVAVLFLLLPVVMLWGITRDFRHDDFAAYSDKLAVVETALSYSPGGEKCGPIVAVVGKIRNDSDIGWKDFYLEARYFNADGTMIDANNDEMYSLFIPPHAEAAFRVRGMAVKPQQDYATHKVLIRSAHSARSRF
jgi:hypothetical protein